MTGISMSCSPTSGMSCARGPPANLFRTCINRFWPPGARPRTSAFFRCVNTEKGRSYFCPPCEPASRCFLAVLTAKGHFPDRNAGIAETPVPCWFAFLFISIWRPGQGAGRASDTALWVESGHPGRRVEPFFGDELLDNQHDGGARAMLESRVGALRADQPHSNRMPCCLSGCVAA